MAAHCLESPSEGLGDVGQGENIWLDMYKALGCISSPAKIKRVIKSRNDPEESQVNAAKLKNPAHGGSHLWEIPRMAALQVGDL